MTIRDNKTYKSIIISVLVKLSDINQWRRDFLVETFILFLLDNPEHVDPPNSVLI
jgi:hypothetical protein